MAASPLATPGLPLRATPQLHKDGVLPSLTYFLGLLMECWWGRVDVQVTHMVPFNMPICLAPGFLDLHCVRKTLVSQLYYL